MKVLARDGLPLEVLANDLRHDATVVFVNALGISSCVAHRLLADFDAQGINFLTWDLRGSPGPYREDFRQYGTSHHVDDLAAILAAVAPKRAVLASWCSGTAIALSAAFQHCLAPVAIAAFCAPNYAGRPRHKLAGDTIERVCAVVAKDEGKLEFYYNTLVANSGLDPLTADLDDEELARHVLAPFKSGPRATLHYAYAMVNAPARPLVQQWCAGIEVPMTFYGAERDVMVSCQDSVALAGLSSLATWRVVEGWNHYSLFHDTGTVVREVESLFRLGPPGRGPVVRS